MLDSVALRRDVTVIVKRLAEALVTERLSPDKHKLQTEERLSALVNSMCLEAVEKILQLVELAAENQGETDSPRSVEASDGLMKTLMTGGDAGGRQCPPTEQTYVLVYGSSAADSNCLGSFYDAANASGQNKRSSSAAEGEPSLSFPPLQTDFSDHKYARLSSPGTTSDRELVVSAAAYGRKWHIRRRRRKEAAPTETETHHECTECGMLFPNPERLCEHRKSSHPVCSACGKLFTGILKLREHESKEHGLLPYTCDYCPKRFNHKAHRDLHVKARHTGEKTCHCDICGKGYTCISVLKTHRMTHFEKTFICDICGKSFYHACHLTRHKLVHQEVRPYQCSTCGKGFTQAANLRSHQVIHTGDRQLCSICGKSYRCLKNHVISKHSHELPVDELPARDSIITCEVCGKKFPNPSQFRVHQRSHTGEKPFHCDICGKSYRLKELLRDHRYTHTGEKPYKCSLCPKTFNLATSFMRHRSIHSGATPYSCHDCGKHFRLLTFLKAHLQTKAHLKQTQHRDVSSDL
ncbi:hypothetical protein Q5P01_021902 [Channa striata]|uniref:C2H2-type domain-containing protein n=1 Tax=Channa striata TaxID=64152 RepID=A0AA88LVX0_CHASR|nr:hypothetical protein Q5P01_021902 [Channa striata]